MAQPDSGAVPRRPHHISSIAHLFLQEDGRDLGGSNSTEGIDVAVATPGCSPISAFAAAGLAARSPRSTTLSENKRVRWSAGTFLRRNGENADVHATGGDAHHEVWNLSAAAGQGTGGAAAQPFRWSHLGCLGQAGLARLESLSAARSLGFPVPGSAGLIWCVLAMEAAAMSPSYLLGRLAGLIRPPRIRILVFPDVWSDAGRPGWLEKIQGEDFSTARERDVTRCAELAELVCHRIPVKIHLVAGPDNLASSFGEDAAEESLWRRVVLGMSPSRAG